MTIKEIKEAIFYQNAIIKIRKHRKIKGTWEHFVFYPNGELVKIQAKRSKAAQRYLATRVNMR